jgi:hypothetical protein
MSGKTTPQPFSDNFFSGDSSPSMLSQKSHAGAEHLFPIDESPDFHDPYSDLNLFLSQKIKQEMGIHGSAKKWSTKIQEDLVKRITPDFQAQFPHYRLGVSALKKTWEKISAYIQHIQHQQGAISQDGKLNVHFFIKENLKASSRLRSPFNLPAYTYAHQLAMKISECVATVDGIRPKLDHLIKLIWSVQRHLLAGMNPEQGKCPYDEYDQIDKLIVKMILEITSKNPKIKQPELEHEVKAAIRTLQQMPSLAELSKETLPLHVSHRLKTEIANAIIDNPTESSDSIAQIAGQFFKRVKELPLSDQLSEIDRKIHHWTVQGDMLCKWIRLDHGAPLLKFMIERWKGREVMSPRDFVRDTYDAYLALRPELLPYSTQLMTRVWILFKYCWYAVFAQAEESSLDRFIKWHTAEIAAGSPHLTPEELNQELKELCMGSLPLIPSELIKHAS